MRRSALLASLPDALVGDLLTANGSARLATHLDTIRRTPHFDDIATKEDWKSAAKHLKGLREIAKARVGQLEHKVEDIRGHMKDLDSLQECAHHKCGKDLGPLKVKLDLTIENLPGCIHAGPRAPASFEVSQDPTRPSSPTDKPPVCNPEGCTCGDNGVPPPRHANADGDTPDGYTPEHMYPKLPVLEPRPKQIYRNDPYTYTTRQQQPTLTQQAAHVTPCATVQPAAGAVQATPTTTPAAVTLLKSAMRAPGAARRTTKQHRVRFDTTSMATHKRRRAARKNIFAKLFRRFGCMRG